MADINQSNWSEVDSSNNSASPNGWTSGTMTPSQVEPTARAMMGAIKRWHDQISPTLTSGGTANAQTLTHAVPHTAYVAGDVFGFIAGATNTGNTVLNVDGLGNKTVKTGSTSLAGGEIVAGEFYMVGYDGTNLQLLRGAPPRFVLQKFTSSGTYTPTTGLVTAWVRCKGGGGGGGGVLGTGTAASIGAGGGGEGSESRARLTSVQIGASQVVTIGAGGAAGSNSGGNGGAGGDTSIGSLCIGKGGSGGIGATVTGTGGAGGAAGVAGTGDETFPGAPGGNGLGASIATIEAMAGSGGGAGGIGAQALSTFAVPGTSASANTGGGGGGGAASNTGAGAGGGAGGSGWVEILELVAG